MSDNVWIEGETESVYLLENKHRYSHYTHYVSGQRWRDHANQLITNFKKLSQGEKKSQQELNYRNTAIQKISEIFINRIKQARGQKILLVDCPSGSGDDRLVQVSRKINENCENIIYIENIISTKSTRSYSRDNTITRNEQEMKKYKSSLRRNAPIPENDVVLFIDDVITSGLHYRAIYDFLIEQENIQKIVGLFFARTKWDNG